MDRRSNRGSLQSAGSTGSGKSIKDLFFRCFSSLGRKQAQSDSDADSDNDYVLINQKVFKFPREDGEEKVVKEKVVESCFVEENSAFEAAASSRVREVEDEDEMVVERLEADSRAALYRGHFDSRDSDQDFRVSSKRRKSSGSSPRSYDSRRYALHDPKKEKVYEYIRKKTYERVNPYNMSPNDFLNNISSIFVENLKDPIPKDPRRRPKVYNRTIKKKSKGIYHEFPFGKKKKTEKHQHSREQSSGARGYRRGYEREATNSGKMRRRTHQAGVCSDTVGSSAFSYKDAVERDAPYRVDNEKVLIWKIVVESGKSSSL